MRSSFIVSLVAHFLSDPSLTETLLAKIQNCYFSLHAFIFQSLQPTSDDLVAKVAHVDFQMKMEDMHLSGPDNTKLEVSLRCVRCWTGGRLFLLPVCPGLGP